MGGAALVKSAAIWLCVGALSGGTVAAVSSYVSEAGTEQRPSASAPARVRAAVPPAESPKPTTVPEAVEPAIELPITEVGAAPVGRSSSASTPAEPVAPVVPPGGSVAAFDVPNARPGLYEELKWLEAARGAAGRGDYASALSTLDRYDAGYPAGHFRPESMALRIEALSRLGNRDAARALAERFRKSYPSHPMLSRVRAAIGE